MAALSEAPGDWELHQDDASGAAYFYNVRTGDASWDVPAGATGSALSEGPGDDDGRSIGPGVVEGGPQQWTEAFDESGHVYFVNLRTMETRWDLPPAVASSSDDRIVDTTPGAAGRATLVESSDGERLTTAEQMEKLNRLLSGDDNDEDDAEDDERGDDTTSGAVDAAPLRSRTLPLDHEETGAAGAGAHEMLWMMFLNESDGVPYYYNHVTGDCVWDPPADFVAFHRSQRTPEQPLPTEHADDGDAAAVAPRSSEGPPSARRAAALREVVVITPEFEAKVRRAIEAVAKTPVGSSRVLLVRTPSEKGPALSLHATGEPAPASGRSGASTKRGGAQSERGLEGGIAVAATPLMTPGRATSSRPGSALGSSLLTAPLIDAILPIPLVEEESKGGAGVHDAGDRITSVVAREEVVEPSQPDELVTEYQRDALSSLAESSVYSVDFKTTGLATANQLRFDYAVLVLECAVRCFLARRRVQKKRTDEAQRSLQPGELESEHQIGGPTNVKSAEVSAERAPMSEEQLCFDQAALVLECAVRCFLARRRVQNKRIQQQQLSLVKLEEHCALEPLGFDSTPRVESASIAQRQDRGSSAALVSVMLDEDPVSESTAVDQEDSSMALAALELQELSDSDQVCEPAQGLLVSATVRSGVEIEIPAHAFLERDGSSAHTEASADSASNEEQRGECPVSGPMSTFSHLDSVQGDRQHSATPATVTELEDLTEPSVVDCGTALLQEMVLSREPTERVPTSHKTGSDSDTRAEIESRSSTESTTATVAPMRSARTRALTLPAASPSSTRTVAAAAVPHSTPSLLRSAASIPTVLEVSQYFQKRVPSAAATSTSGMADSAAIPIVRKRVEIPAMLKPMPVSVPVLPSKRSHDERQAKKQQLLRTAYAVQTRKREQEALELGELRQLYAQSAAKFQHKRDELVLARTRAERERRQHVTATRSCRETDASAPLTESPPSSLWRMLTDDSLNQIDDALSSLQSPATFLRSMRRERVLELEQRVCRLHEDIEHLDAQLEEIDMLLMLSDESPRTPSEQQLHDAKTSFQAKYASKLRRSQTQLLRCRTFWQTRIDEYTETPVQSPYWRRVDQHFSTLGSSVASTGRCVVSSLRDANGDSLLHVAAWNGQLALVEKLLALRSVDVNAVDSTVSLCRPLHEACRGGHVAVARLFVAAGASLDAVDAMGDSALHIACRLGWSPVARFLLTVFASPVAVSRASDAYDKDRLQDCPCRSTVALFQLQNHKKRRAIDLAKLPSLVVYLQRTWTVKDVLIAVLDACGECDRIAHLRLFCSFRGSRDRE